ncbi:MAG: type II toxin-antitoxin system VapC family toxin [Gemmatimonas sp.]
MIVTDANLLAYLVLPGERTAESEAVLLMDPVWVAPVLWRSELRSVVHKYVSRGDITLARAVALLEQAEGILEGREGEVDSRNVLELASRSKCSTYDCEYVALAVALGVPLVTTDRAVLRDFAGIAIAPQVFLSR